MILRKTFRFEASHILPKHPGKCSRLHGHSWVLHVAVSGPIDEVTGFVMDYAKISELIKPLIDSLDHHHLGTWDKDKLPYHQFWNVSWLPNNFYPSSENLLMAIGKQLEIFTWHSLALEETCTSYAELTREEFDATINKK